MRDDPEIVKELREVEKLGMLWAKTTDDIAEFEVVEETTEDIPDESVGFVEDDVEKKQEEANINNEKLPWESEEKWRLLLKNLPNIVLLVDRDGTIQYINHTVSGLTPEQVIGKNHIEFISPEYHDMVKEVIEQVFQTGNIGDYEIKGKGPKGGISWYASHIGPIKSDGQIVAVSIVTTDVTERKKAEDVLNESEEKYHDLFENANDIIQAVKPDASFLYVNRAWKQTLGYNDEEVAKLSVFDIIHRDSKDHCTALFKRIMSGESMDDIETSFVTKSGKKIVVEGRINCRFKDGKPVSTRGIFRDITERKRTEETIKSERNKLQVLMNGLANANIGIDIVGIDYKIEFQNQVLEERFGDLNGKLCYEKYMGLKEPCDSCPMIKAVKNNKMGRVELTADDGRNYEVLSAPLPNPDGTVDKAIEVVRDITERKKAEEVLATGTIHRRILIEQSRDGIVVLDQDGNVYESNQRFAEMLGFSPEEVSHLHVWDWDFQFTREQLRDMLRNVDETGDNFETQHRRKDGTIYDVEISTNGAVFEGEKLIFCVCRDITERKKADETLQNAKEKLERKVEELEQYKKVTVGRELKMVELKKKIKELEEGVKK